MRKVAGLIALLVPLASSSAWAATSSFSSNDEGWRIVSFADLFNHNYAVVSPAGGYAPTYNPTGGNPGGYISTTDPDGGDFTFSAPAAFLGNASAAYGTNLTYQMNDLQGVNYQAPDVILTNGNSSSSVLRLVYAPATPFTPTSTFQNVSVPLTASALWHVNTGIGPAPTATEFQSVLANLSGLFIRGEYQTGPDNTGLDNVNFTVPEPSSAIALGGLIVGSALRRRRRARA